MVTTNHPMPSNQSSRTVSPSLGLPPKRSPWVWLQSTVARDFTLGPDPREQGLPQCICHNHTNNSAINLQNSKLFAIFAALFL